MNYIKNKWLIKDVEEFNNYLYTIRITDKINWTKNLLNTKYDVLAIKTIDLKNVVKEIFKGNYVSYLEKLNFYCYESVAIYGLLICKLKDFELIKKYLDIYSRHIDSWALTDLLKFNVKGKEKEYINLINEYIASELTFKRRIAIKILFSFINDEYIDYIFEILDSLNNEKEYYVNMINAWILCECFIKQRAKTLEYFTKHKLNKFTINKAISKCRDSYRVSKEDKELLLKYKQ